MKHGGGGGGGEGGGGAGTDMHETAPIVTRLRNGCIYRLEMVRVIKKT